MSNLFLVDVSAVAHTFYKIRTIPNFSWEVDGETVYTKAMFAIFKVVSYARSKKDKIVLCADSRSKRKDFDSTYKSNRVKAPEDFYEQVNRSLGIFKKCGFDVIKEDGMEADDLIYSLVQQYKGEYDHVHIITNDNDLACNIDKNVSIITTVSSRPNITIDNYESVLHTPYNTIMLKKCIMGDGSDVIKGISGYGKVSADRVIAGIANTHDLTQMCIADNVEKVLREQFEGDTLEQALHSFALVKPEYVSDIKLSSYAKQDYASLREQAALYGMKTVVAAINKL